jgi:hypothetical protein
MVTQQPRGLSYIQGPVLRCGAAPYCLLVPKYLHAYSIAGE